MCGFFDSKDNIYRGFVRASEPLVQRTRLVEASMTGDPVPETAWEAFFSAACAAIEWPHFERMFEARTAAVAYLAVHSSFKPPPRPSAFRCIAD